MTSTISALIDILGIYLVVGFLFSVWFVTRGAEKLDKGVCGTPWHFRLMILPGSILLWSVLVVKLLKNKS